MLAPSAHAPAAAHTCLRCPPAEHAKRQRAVPSHLRDFNLDGTVKRSRPAWAKRDFLDALKEVARKDAPVPGEILLGSCMAVWPPRCSGGGSAGSMVALLLGLKQWLAQQAAAMPTVAQSVECAGCLLHSTSLAQHCTELELPCPAAHYKDEDGTSDPGTSDHRSEVSAGSDALTH